MKGSDMEIKRSCLDCRHGFAFCKSDVIAKSCGYMANFFQDLKLPGYVDTDNVNGSFDYTDKMGERVSKFISRTRIYVDCDAYDK